MSFITLVHAVVSRLPIRREQTHGGAQASDTETETGTKPRDGTNLQRRLFLQSRTERQTLDYLRDRVDGPPVEAAVDSDGRLVIHSQGARWVRAEKDSYLAEVEFR